MIRILSIAQHAQRATSAPSFGRLDPTVQPMVLLVSTHPIISSIDMHSFQSVKLRGTSEQRPSRLTKGVIQVKTSRQMLPSY